MKTYTEKRFGEMYEDNVSVTLRSRGGSAGGGSEVLVVETYGFKPNQGSKAEGLGYEYEKCPTLNATNSCGGLLISYQETVGTVNPGAHPGSYNGQDAYSDMLITEHGESHLDITQLYAHGGFNGADYGTDINGCERPSDSNGLQGGAGNERS